LAKHLSGKPERTAHRGSVDPHSELGVRQHGGDRGNRWRNRCARGEIGETVVFDEAQGERPRRFRTPRHDRLGTSASNRAQNQQACQHAMMRFARHDVASYFRARLTANSNDGTVPSAVSSDTRKIEGPNSGKATSTGSTPTTRRSPPSLLKRSTRLCKAAAGA